MKRLCASLILLVLVCGGVAGSAAAQPSADRPPVTGRASLTPDTHLFAEPVVAAVDLVVDRTRLDPSRVRVDATFAPYERVGKTSVERHDVGERSYLRYTTTLRCLRADCIPRTRTGEVQSSTNDIPSFVQGQTRDEKRTYRFRPAEVLYDDTTSGTRDLTTVRWPPLRSLSRVNWSDPSVSGQGFPFRASVAPLPEPSFRVPPVLLAFTLLGLAAALLVLPVAAVIRVRRGRSQPEEVAEPELSPLELALLTVEWARTRSEVDRRESLEVLAVELEAEGRADFAALSRELAWSRQVPTSEDVGRVLDIVQGGADALG